MSMNLSLRGCKGSVLSRNNPYLYALKKRADRFQTLFMNKKYILTGMSIGLAGLILSHTYRPYIYANHIQDFHIADTIGSIVCVPAAVLFFYGLNDKRSVKEYTHYVLLTYIGYELLGLFNIHIRIEHHVRHATPFRASSRQPAPHRRQIAAT